MGMHAHCSVCNSEFQNGVQVIGLDLLSPLTGPLLNFFLNIALCLSKLINVTKSHSPGAFFCQIISCFHFLRIFETNSFKSDWNVFFTPLSCLDVFIKKKKTVDDENIKFSSQFYLLILWPYPTNFVMCPRNLPILMLQRWDYKSMRFMPPYLAVILFFKGKVNRSPTEASLRPNTVFIPHYLGARYILSSYSGCLKTLKVFCSNNMGYVHWILNIEMSLHLWDRAYLAVFHVIYFCSASYFDEASVTVNEETWAVAPFPRHLSNLIISSSSFGVRFIIPVEKFSFLLASLIIHIRLTLTSPGISFVVFWQ